MSSENEILERLKQAVIKGDADESSKIAEEILIAKIDPMVAIKKGAAEGIRIVGDKFGRMEMFLTEMMFSAEAMKVAVAILKSKFDEKKLSEVNLGTIVIGTVKGDIHDIGKNLVIIMLESSGFKVHDLGVDIAPPVFIEKAQELNADIIAASSILSSTMPNIEDIASLIRDAGLKEKFKLIVGGAAVTPEWAEEIGSDGYGKDAEDAVQTAKKVLGI
jgi:methanogenic corrinoid protein MtbC1